MSKLKIYVYPNAKEHVQDNMEKQYFNTIPLSKQGIEDHCEIVSAEKADYFYMGQVSCGLPLPSKAEFKYLDGNEERHIIDFEGDWFNKSIPDWLKNSLVSVSGVKKEYSGIKIFTRPALSYLLMNIIRNDRKVKHTFEKNKTFGFKGFADPRGIRIKTAKACELSGVKTDIIFNNSWQGKASVKSKAVSDYCKMILQNTFSLCPSGTGVDSVRFFEVCFFSRIPVVVGENFTMGHNFNKTNPFYFQIDPYLPTDSIALKIKEIENTPIETLKKMSINSKKFFDEVVKSYFDDPTRRFIEWLQTDNKQIPNE
jgi:hypothetical protein